MVSSSLEQRRRKQCGGPCDRKKLHFSSFLTHSLGAEWSPKVADLANLQAGIAVVNLFDKEYRMLNGSYGSGRGVRLWLSAQF